MREWDEYDETDDDGPDPDSSPGLSVHWAIVVAHAMALAAAVGGAMILGVLAKLMK
jgi:hypothetical protein